MLKRRGAKALDQGEEKGGDPRFHLTNAPNSNAPNATQGASPTILQRKPHVSDPGNLGLALQIKSQYETLFDGLCPPSMALLNDQASQSRSVTIETFELSNPTSRKIIQVDKTLCGYLYTIIHSI